MKILYDCKFYRGDKPCKYSSLCSNCRNYQPAGKKLLIVKLGAMGDALRTTAILPALKRKYKTSDITWITDEASYPLLKMNSLIDHLYILDLALKLRLETECFDLLLSFDKAIEAVSLASVSQANEKLGFCLTKEGKLSVFNKESEYALMLGISDDLKFRQNQKSYQQIIFEMAKLDYQGEEYVIELSEKDVQWGKEYFINKGIQESDTTIGLFTGCGDIFLTKKWTIDGFTALGELLNEKTKAKIILLGGPNEFERNKAIKSRLNFGIIDTGCNNSLSHFAAILNSIDVVVAADTLPFHLAIGLKRKVVGIFTSTCAQEIELYGRGEIIKSGLDCSPCYKNYCKTMECADDIKPEQIFEAVKRRLGSKLQEIL